MLVAAFTCGVLVCFLFLFLSLEGEVRVGGLCICLLLLFFFVMLRLKSYSEVTLVPTDSQMMKSYIWLQTADGSIQQVEQEVAMFCPMICQENIQKGMGSSKNHAISLPERVNTSMLSLIIDYCRFHQVPGRSNKVLHVVGMSFSFFRVYVLSLLLPTATVHEFELLKTIIFHLQWIKCFLWCWCKVHMVLWLGAIGLCRNARLLMKNTSEWTQKSSVSWLQLLTASN